MVKRKIHKNTCVPYGNLLVFSMVNHCIRYGKLVFFMIISKKVVFAMVKIPCVRYGCVRYGDLPTKTSSTVQADLTVPGRN